MTQLPKGFERDGYEPLQNQNTAQLVYVILVVQATF